MEELEEIKCPLCDESFRDKRGLTSHARNIHELEKGEIFKKMSQKEKDKKEWRLIGGLGAILVTVLTFGSLK